MGKQVYHIMSLVPQNGAKYVAINLGYFIKKNKKSKVLLIDLDYEYPTLGYPYSKNKDYSISDLVPIKNSINKGDLKKIITKTSIGLDILKGSSFYSEDNIPQDLILKVIELSKENYDYIIVVTNPTLKKVSTAMTLLNADENILVLRNNYSNAIKIENFLKEYERFKKNINIVINFKNYKCENHVLKYAKEVKNLKINYLGELVSDKKASDNLNLKNKGFFNSYSSNNKEFRSMLKKLRI